MILDLKEVYISFHNKEHLKKFRLVYILYLSFAVRKDRNGRVLL